MKTLRTEEKRKQIKKICKDEDDVDEDDEDTIHIPWGLDCLSRHRQPTCLRRCNTDSVGVATTFLSPPQPSACHRHVTDSQHS